MHHVVHGSLQKRIERIDRTVSNSDPKALDFGLALETLWPQELYIIVSASRTDDMRKQYNSLMKSLRIVLEL